MVLVYIILFILNFFFKSHIHDSELKRYEWSPMNSLPAPAPIPEALQSLLVNPQRPCAQT